MLTYSHEDFIEKAINSILLQETNFEFELVLVNDCSPDKTDLIISRILNTHSKASIINYLKNQTNKGMMPNFMFALDYCQSKYLAFCEGDDYWTDPLKLQKQVDKMEAEESVSACFSEVDYVDGMNNLIGESNRMPIGSDYLNFDYLAQQNVIHTCSFIIRQTALNQKIKEILSASKNVGDFILFYAAALQGSIFCFREKQAAYRKNVGVMQNWSNTVGYNNMLDVYILFEKSNLLTKKELAIFNISRPHIYYKLTERNLIVGDLKSAFLAFLQMNNYLPYRWFSSKIIVHKITMKAYLKVLKNLIFAVFMTKNQTAVKHSI